MSFVAINYSTVHTRYEVHLHFRDVTHFLNTDRLSTLKRSSVVNNLTGPGNLRPGILYVKRKKR